MSDKGVFDEGSEAPAQLASAIVGGIEEAENVSVTILMYLINDETGQIVCGSSLAPEQVTDFLQHILRSHRTGEFGMTKVMPETKQ